MKILLLGEYSNVHATLAKGLKAMGHEVTVVSNGDFWKNYPRDINLVRRPGKLGGLSYYFKIKRLLPSLRGYDIVQLINPMFLEIKARRILPIYQYLRRHNGKMIMGAFGMDYYWVNECVEHKPLRYSDFNIGEELRTDSDAMKERSDWIGTDKEHLNRYIAEDCDGIVAGLYEYWVCYQPYFPEKTVYIPYPIVVDTTTTAVTPVHQPLRLFIGINRERSAYKGTDIMLRAAEKVVKAYPGKVVLEKAESVPYAQYQTMMENSDAILDQLYSYTPSMNSLLAMSKGIVCIGGGEEEHYKLLKEEKLRPIVNVEPTEESVVTALVKLVTHPEEVTRLKKESIEYILRHHDYMKRAKVWAARYL